MTYQVQFSTEAERQLVEIDAWFKLNRSAAHELVQQELDRLLLRLETMPFLGKVYRGTQRRCLLRRSQFHVYYTVDEVAHVVEIDAVWSAHRGSGPLR